jgi:hypothetical protein
MNDYAQWLEANDRFLAAALAELRARLERAGQRHDASAAPPAAPATALMESAPAVSVSAASKPSWLARMFRAPRLAAPTQAGPALAGDRPAASPVVAVVPDADVNVAATAAPASASGDEANHTPAWNLLASRLGLTAFERDVLLLCIGMEPDTRFPALCAQA